jgi:hypothetical protein
MGDTGAISGAGRRYTEELSYMINDAKKSKVPLKGTLIGNHPDIKTNVLIEKGFTETKLPDLKIKDRNEGGLMSGAEWAASDWKAGNELTRGAYRLVDAQTGKKHMGYIAAVDNDIVLFNLAGEAVAVLEETDQSKNTLFTGGTIYRDGAGTEVKAENYPRVASDEGYTIEFRGQTQQEGKYTPVKIEFVWK